MPWPQVLEITTSATQRQSVALALGGLSIKSNPEFKLWFDLNLLILGTGLDSAMGVTTLWNMACLHDDLRDGVMNSGVLGVRGVLSKLIAL